jgi:poly(hydroxyalkanoate) depolymerase family esterase
MAVDWRKLYADNQAVISGAAPRPGAAPMPALDRPRALATGLGNGAPVRGAGHRAPVHVPRGLDAHKPAPLVCMLHGCTQSPATFAAATLMNDAADRHEFVVAYPGQERGRNPQGCWNWFAPEHQQRDAGEPAAIASTVRDLIRASSGCTIDPQRVFVAGLSSGGAMAAILAACYPDLFAAVAVHSGLAYRSASTTASAFEVMARGGGDAGVQGRAAHDAMGSHARPVPSLVIHGSADRTVAPANALAVLRQSMVANTLASEDAGEHDPERPTRTWRGEVEGGLAYTQSQWVDSRGALVHELLVVDGLGHGWSGGAPGGSYADSRGPSASEAIWAFFAQSAESRPS